MKNAKLKVECFDESDVIATSVYEVKGLMNGVVGDSTFTLYAKQGDTTGGIDVKSKYFTSAYSFAEGEYSVKGDKLSSDKDGSTERQIIELYGAGHDYGSILNGWYTFDSVNNIFTKIKQ